MLDRMEEALHTHLGCSEDQNPLENGGKIVRKTWENRENHGKHGELMLIKSFITIKGISYIIGD